MTRKHGITVASLGRASKGQVVRDMFKNKEQEQANAYIDSSSWRNAYGR